MKIKIATSLLLAACAALVSASGGINSSCKPTIALSKLQENMPGMLQSLKFDDRIPELQLSPANLPTIVYSAIKATYEMHASSNDRMKVIGHLSNLLSRLGAAYSSHQLNLQPSCFSTESRKTAANSQGFAPPFRPIKLMTRLFGNEGYFIARHFHTTAGIPITRHDVTSTIDYLIAHRGYEHGVQPFEIINKARSIDKDPHSVVHWTFLSAEILRLANAGAAIDAANLLYKIGHQLNPCVDPATAGPWVHKVLLPIINSLMKKAKNADPPLLFYTIHEKIMWRKSMLIASEHISKTFNLDQTPKV